MPKPKRRDYASNARKHYSEQTGCMWCGGQVEHLMSYCSDECLQADMEGIDDLPPVMVLQPGNGPNSTYVARKIAEYNAAYPLSGDGDATGGGPYTPGSVIEEFGSDE
jgi:hypothetical protein